MNIQDLDNLYRLFNFKKIDTHDGNIIAYAHRGSYFINADIIKLRPNANPDKAISHLTEMGYACSVREYKSFDEAKEQLFKGFFEYSISRDLTLTSYHDYCGKISKFIGCSYEYLPSKFFEYYTGVERRENIIETILNDFGNEKPILVILEAAAGFGKTSTSYEILSMLTKGINISIPLIAELSRHRQANIFKYVLYEEINQKFPGIRLEAVIYYIKEGWIPLIIDGFDELLRNISKDDRENDNFEESETMLETIKELLDGKAKILLTTRRTALFSDDDLFELLSPEANENQWILTRYVLNTPTINDWISTSRVNLLQKNDFDINNLSNPVILSYLRSLDDVQFEEIAQNPNQIVNQYFERILTRENERQNLKMTPDEQESIIKSISNHLVQNDIKMESKEAIEATIKKSNRAIIQEVLKRYTTKEPMTEEILVNKFSMHALIDRKGESEIRIGFVNDFIFGTFIGKNILDSDKEWFGTERYVDFVITSYKSRDIETKILIWEGLEFIMDMLSTQRQIQADICLRGKIFRNVLNDSISDLTFSDEFCDEAFYIENTVFSNCRFMNITFISDQLKNVFFIQCQFYNCSIKVNEIPKISLSGCEEHNSTITSVLQDYHEQLEEQILNDDEDAINKYKKHVLERFWPLGKERFTTHRVITTLRMGVRADEIDLLEEAIDQLVKDDLIIRERGKASLGLNIKKINEIKQIIGR